MEHIVTTRIVSYIIIIKCIVCIHSCELCLFISVVVALANAECTFDIELLVDDEPWSFNEVLYKPVGNGGSFVRCRWCNDSTLNSPRWRSTPACIDKMPVICEVKGTKRVRDLHFSNFTQSQAGNYTCKGNGGTQSIMIAVLSPPTVTTHPTSHLANVSMSVTLACEGTDDGEGSITYHWETSNINGGQWMNISNSNSKTLVVRNLEQSQRYRCVVSNEAGSTRSDVATVTVLSKYGTT